MRIYKKVVFFLAIAIISASCGSYKKIPYFQNISKDAPTKEKIRNYSPVTIQPSDILSITITSLNPEASAVFNTSSNSANGSAGNPNNAATGYLVDEQGNIRLPLIGSLKVSGLTTAGVTAALQQRLVKYLQDPVVNVRIVNFKISVLGDVEHPGVYHIQNEKVTLTEAISLAGDLNITALRKIVLIRETNDDREYIPIDLTSDKLFQSPYYYLKNNDVIYVQPGKAKYASADNSYRNIGLVLSALSIIAIILTRTN